MANYGVNSDGYLTLCKAKPENRGKGRCNHADHVELNASTEEINTLNEKILAQRYPEVKVNKAVIDNDWGGRTLSKEEFNSSVNAVAQQFHNEDYTFIKEFYNKYDARFRDANLKKRFKNATDNVHDFLSSNDPVAVQTREYLGKEVNLRTFSEILAKSVGAMTESAHWKNNGQSPRLHRVLLTNVNNDMTKERYVASVMFFGGRCCYCRKVLTRDGTPQAASGEHITPINPDSPPPGSTRFGNMALACIECNKKRGNEQFDKWIENTDAYSNEQKQAIVGRIQKFRNYALYSDYTIDQEKEVTRSVNKIRKVMNALPIDNKKKFSAEGAKQVRIAILEEQERLRKVLK